MSLEKRLAALEDAHRALHARHEALAMSSRVLLPLLSIDPASKKRLMTIAYDALTEHMDNANMDDEFQQIARGAIDEIFSAI
jgi:hypothetical protein